MNTQHLSIKALVQVISDEYHKQMGIPIPVKNTLWYTFTRSTTMENLFLGILNNRSVKATSIPIKDDKRETFYEIRAAATINYKPHGYERGTITLVEGSDLEERIAVACHMVENPNNGHPCPKSTMVAIIRSKAYHIFDPLREKLTKRGEEFRADTDVAQVAEKRTAFLREQRRKFQVDRIQKFFLGELGRGIDIDEEDVVRLWRETIVKKTVTQ